jgi:hypothetical protein
VLDHQQGLRLWVNGEDQGVVLRLAVPFPIYAFIDLNGPYRKVCIIIIVVIIIPHGITWFQRQWERYLENDVGGGGNNFVFLKLCRLRPVLLYYIVLWGRVKGGGGVEGRRQHALFYREPCTRQKKMLSGGARFEPTIYSQICWHWWSAMNCSAMSRPTWLLRNPPFPA